MADLKVLSETDLFSTMSKSDYSSVNEDNSSLKYLTKTYFNNNDANENLSISINQMFKTQNTNAPGLFNIFKKKFHRSRKYKMNRELKKEIHSKSFVEELLEKPISNNGTSGIWMVDEKDIVFPLIKNFDTSISGQYNVSRALSSLTNDSLDLYHYDFPTVSTPILIDHQPEMSSIIIEETEQIDENIPAIASVVKTSYRINQEMEMLSISPAITEDVQLISANSTIQTKSKRAKSASATRSRTINSSSRKRGKGRSKSTTKKKSKYYQEHFLTPEEIELREALRIIDLDNIGFFPPSEFHKVLKEIGISSNDIEKIQQCLPLDEDGHYSIDNLIKLFLETK